MRTVRKIEKDVIEEWVAKHDDMCSCSLMCIDDIKYCDCGQAERVKKLASLRKVVGAVKAWRKAWIDMEDELEMEGGCKCEICQLVRAIDELEANQ